MKRLSLAIASLLVGLLIAEGTLRWRPDLWKNAVQFDAGFRWLEYDPLLGWQNVPRYRDTNISINALSFRGPETSARKVPGTVRIICLGDSRTFGLWTDVRGVRFDNAYPPLLQALATGRSPSQVEVINAGVLGYSSPQGLRQLRLRVVGLDPDVVVVSFGFNDHSFAWNPALRSREPRGRWARTLLYSFADVRTLQFGLRLYQSLAPHPAPLSVRWADPEEYEYTLRRFVEMARENNIRLVFLAQALRPIELGDSPPFPGRTPNDPYALLGAPDLRGLHRVEGEYQSVMRRVAAESGTPVADAAAAFASHHGAPLFGRHDVVHPNPAGARVIAQTVYATLHDLGAL